MLVHLFLVVWFVFNKQMKHLKPSFMLLRLSFNDMRKVQVNVVVYSLNGAKTS